MPNNASYADKVTGTFRLIIPGIVFLILFLLNTASFSSALGGTAKPPFVLMAVYYWSIYRPSLMPVWFLFVVGITMDLLGGLPPGLTAITLVAAGWIISNQRRFFMAQPFIMIWLGFIMVSWICIVFQWLIHGILYPGWPSLRLAIFTVGYGALLFPVIVFILSLSTKTLKPAKKNMRFGGRTIE